MNRYKEIFHIENTETDAIGKLLIMRNFSNSTLYQGHQQHTRILSRQTMPEHQADLQRLCGDMLAPFTSEFIKET